jgi:DNA-binding transcriptional regulator PaaX
MDRKNLQKTILKTTNGLIGNLTNMILYFIFLQGAMLGKTTSHGIYNAFEESYDTLSEINYDSIRRSLMQLKKKGLITQDDPPKSKIRNYKISQIGRVRLNSLIPTYQTKRPWDGKLRLVSYDIPITANRKRDLLRSILNKLGGAKIQESLWVIPYDYKHLLRKEINNNAIPGTILISELGRDGSIGDIPTKELIRKIYHLDNLNQRYLNFINNYNSGVITFSLRFEYLSILNDDPQLPFQLLPKDFLGEKAWRLYQKYNSIK